MNLVDLIKYFCYNFGYNFYSNYSGRGMFGQECIGIVTNDILSTTSALTQFLYESGVENAAEIVGSCCTDNMGLDYIIYFQDIREV